MCFLGFVLGIRVLGIWDLGIWAFAYWVLGTGRWAFGIWVFGYWMLGIRVFGYWVLGGCWIFGRLGSGCWVLGVGWLVGYLSVGHLGVWVLGVGRFGVSSSRPTARPGRVGHCLFLQPDASPRWVEMSDSVFAPVGVVLCRSPGFSRGRPNARPYLRLGIATFKPDGETMNPVRLQYLRYFYIFCERLKNYLIAVVVRDFGPISTPLFIY